MITCETLEIYRKQIAFRKIVSILVVPRYSVVRLNIFTRNLTFVEA